VGKHILPSLIQGALGMIFRSPEDHKGYLAIQTQPTALLSEQNLSMLIQVII